MPASPVGHVRCVGGGLVHQFLPHGAWDIPGGKGKPTGRLREMRKYAKILREKR